MQGIEWEWQSVDGAMTKAPSRKGATGPNPNDRAKADVKRSLLTDGAVGFTSARVASACAARPVLCVSCRLSGNPLRLSRGSLHCTSRMVQKSLERLRLIK